MKKILALILVFVVLLSACAPKQEPLTAEQVVTKLTDAGLSIDKNSIIVYTPETDENELLGRPNQYTSKVNFSDSRHPAELEDSEPACTVEVFENEKDCVARRDYIQTISDSGPMFMQYIYQKDNMLLRLEKALTPEEASEYEAALKEIK